MATRVDARIRVSGYRTHLIHSASVLLALCSYGVASAQPPDSPAAATYCESVVLYEICGDARLRRAITRTHDDPALNLKMAEEAEVERRLGTLSDRSAGWPTPARIAMSRRHRLEARWNEIAGPAIRRLTVYGGVPFISGNELFVLHLPALAIAPRRELAARFRPSVRFNELGRLMFATEPVARIDLSTRPRAMRVNWSPLRRICNDLIDKPPGINVEECSRAVIRPLELPFLYPTATWKGFNVLDLMTKYYLRLWQFASYVTTFQDYSAITPRRVYAFPARGSASPSVDRFGNLYLPLEMLRDERFDASELELIMMHEAAHIELLGGEFATAAMTLFVNEVAQQALEKAEDVPEKAAARLVPLLQLARRTDETLADMIALRLIGGDSALRGSYQALVERMETVSPDRASNLKRICEYLDEGGEVGRLLAAHAVALSASFAMKDPNQARARLSRYDSTPEWTVSTHLVEAYVEEMARRATEMAQEIMGQDPRAKNPWALERQLQDVYERLRRELRLQLPN